MDLLIVTNAPGEITTWVGPVVRAIRRENKDIRITCLLPFCQFSSGQESNLLAEIPEIGAIIPTRRYLKVLSVGRLPYGLRPDKGVVLHLGGDPIHSLLIARRLGLGAAIYTYRPQNLVRYFEKILVLDDAAKEGIVRSGVEPRRVEVAGDLIVDSIREDEVVNGASYERYSLNKDLPIIGLLAGSRPGHVRYSLPFLLRVAALIREREPGSQFITHLAPTIGDDFLKNVLNRPLPSFIEGSKGVLTEEGGSCYILSEGVRVAVIKEGIEVMGMADIVITIPGSNTGQLAALGVPMLVITPLNAPQFIPLEGIAGLVDRIPGVGGYIKRYLVRRMGKSIPFTALPNIRTRRLVVPEMRGVLRPVEVAERSLGYLRELDREALSIQLRQIMGPKGAAAKVSRAVLQMLLAC